MGSTAAPPNPNAEEERTDSPRIFRAFNPWKATLQECLIARHSTNGAGPLRGRENPDTPLSFGWRETLITLLTDWIPRRIVINLLFHIPSIYISRFEAAINKERLSVADLKRLAHEEIVKKRHRRPPLFELELRPSFVGDYNITQVALIAWFWYVRLMKWSMSNEHRQDLGVYFMGARTTNNIPTLRPYNLHLLVLVRYMRSDKFDLPHDSRPGSIPHSTSRPFL